MRLWKALVNSLSGLQRGIRTEPALRQEMIALGVGAPVAGLISAEPGLLIASLFGVLAVESLNTAVEKLCDKVNPDFDDTIGYIKDLGSLAVLAAILAASALWLPAIWRALAQIRL